jgi:hypothetical protein
MRPVYDPTRDGSSFRSLDDDDVAGICAVYPPERVPGTTSCENRHGFSAQCGDDQPAKNESKGCSVGSPSATIPGATPGLLGLVALVALQRVRRKRSPCAKPAHRVA